MAGRTRVPDDLRAAFDLAVRCGSADDFAARLAAGEAIRPGEWATDRVLAGRITILVESDEVIRPGRLDPIPVWVGRVYGGEVRDVVFKEYARHCHGLHDPRAFWRWAKTVAR